MNNIIDMQNAGYRYLSHLPDAPPIQAVSGMNLAIPKGAFWVILGRNGSGKSTLSRLMNALLLPKEGTVFVDGLETIDETHLWQIRRTVGVVFQNPDNQIVATTVEEDVAFGPENLGVPQPEIRSRVDNALEIVSMSGYLTHSPHMLSGGQKQRVAIAGILAMQPQCVVLDEATSMLDPEGRQEVLQAIRKLHREFGMAVVLITHHMDEAIGADHVLVMQDGGTFLAGTPGEVFQHPVELREAGLDVPQITAFGEALRDAALYSGALPVTREDTAAMMDTVCRMVRISGKISEPGDDMAVTEDGSASERSITVPLIHVRDLRHVYMPGTLYERIALDGVSLAINKGEVLGIIGHTGSGKSTFVQHLNGLLKATSGTLEVEGEVVDAKSLKTLRRKVGLIFQYPEHQLFEETVSKDIAFDLVQRGMAKDDIDRRVDKAARLLSITPEMLVKSPFELSGGQKRRVAIAGVLAMEPAILILDEPTAGLDPKGSREVFALLRSLNREEGTTIVLISHNMEDIAAFSDRVAVFREGRLAMLDTPRAVFARQDELLHMHLDVPAITRLFRDTEKRLDIRLPSVLTVPEAISCILEMGKGGVA